MHSINIYSCFMQQEQCGGRLYFSDRLQKIPLPHVHPKLVHSQSDVFRLLVQYLNYHVYQIS